VKIGIKWYYSEGWNFGGNEKEGKVLSVAKVLHPIFSNPHNLGTERNTKK